MAEKKKSPKRTTRKFQLRVEHPIDSHVLEILDYARSKRREVTVIREAITLYWALEQGDLSALFDKFPQYKLHMDTRFDEIKMLLEGKGVGTGSTASIRLPAPEAPKAVAEEVYVDVAASADAFMNMFS